VEGVETQRAFDLKACTMTNLELNKTYTVNGVRLKKHWGREKTVFCVAEIATKCFVASDDFAVTLSAKKAQNSVPSQIDQVLLKFRIISHSTKTVYGQRIANPKIAIIE
jgi:hypothetical protein